MLKEFYIVEDRPAQENYFNTYQIISSNANSYQLSIVTSTMNECNMGFFFMEMKVLICYFVNIKKKYRG